MPANWYKEQPSNRNYLSPIGFKIVLELFEGVDFFCQSATLPEISVPVTEVPTRLEIFLLLGEVEFLMEILILLLLLMKN